MPLARGKHGWSGTDIVPRSPNQLRKRQHEFKAVLRAVASSRSRASCDDEWFESGEIRNYHNLPGAGKTIKCQPQIDGLVRAIGDETIDLGQRHSMS